MSRHDLHQEIQTQRRIANVIFLAIGLILVATIIAAILFMSSGGAALEAYSDVAIPAEIDEPAPEVSAENINGNIESLNDYRGKVVLVNTWGTWCPPCQTEMPMLVAFYNTHASEGFVVIAINAREFRGQVVKFADEYKITFPLWLDPNGDALDAFKNRILPSSYAIDRTGTMRYMWAGMITQDTLEKYIIPLIQENY